MAFFVNLLLTLSAAFLGSLAFPNFLSENQGVVLFAYVFLIPMFYVIYKAKFKTVWFYGLVYGFVYYLIYNYWLKTFHPLAILIAPILESVQYVVLFLALKLVTKLFKKRSYLALAIVYSGYLYLTQLGFLAYPYGNLTAAVYQMRRLIQITDIGGIWLLGFIMVLPQALIAKLLIDKKLSLFKFDILAVFLLYLLTLCYGQYRISSFENRTAQETLRVATVQHSADSWQGGYTTYRRNFETMRDLSLEALTFNPDFIAWSETAFVPSVSWHTAYPHNSVASRLCKEFIDFGTSLPVPLVTGNPEGVIDKEELGPFLEDGSFNWKTYNTVILFGNGEVLSTYRKQHLVPFTEHFPYEKQFPRLYKLLLANDYKWWEKGTEATVFDYNGIKFSTPICFEDTFGLLSAQFVKNGADFLLNLTNDSWSGSVAAEMQHMQLSVFRAVENRRPLLRSTNSGITCLIDESGSVINKLEPFSVCYGLYDIPLYKETGLTFYTRYPDLFGKLLLTLSLLLYPFGIVYYCYTAKKIREEQLYQRYNKLFSSLPDYYEV